MFDGKAFGLEIVGAVKAHVADVMAPILKRLDKIEARLAVPSVSEDDFSAVKSDVESLRLAIAELPIAKDGKDADPEAIADIVSSRLRAEIEELRSGLDALTPQVEAIGGAIGEEIATQVAKSLAEAVAALPRPQDGKSVTIDDIMPMLETLVSKAVESIPLPEDGKDGADGRDGADVVEMLIDRDGALVATLSNGKAKILGPVVGKDGAPGQNGVDGDPGRDGCAGLGFEDMTEELAEDGRTIVRRYQRGDQVKEFRHTFPVVLDRGVYKEGQTYQAGDGVTWAGSFWIAQEETSDKPDSGKGFRLAVKRGRDGKDGVVKANVGPAKVKVA